MKNARYKKYLVVGLLIAIAISGVGVHVAAAQTVGSPPAAPSTGGIFSCFGNLTTCVIYAVSYFINSIIYFLVNLGVILIGLGLSLDQNVFSSPTIQNGFSATLAVANLGFVLGIIIIALATILRRETYGIKKLLWKLVVMAIFVNFGLVVTAPIVGFSDSLSNYFVQASAGSNSNFTTKLTAAFSPQSLPQPPPQPSAPVDTSNCNFLQGNPQTAPAYQNCVSSEQKAATVANQTTSSGVAGAADKAMQAIFSLVFSSIFAALVAFTFLSIGIMLIIRYLYLGFLLIILPIAWLLWVFPKLSSNFSKWWDHFIRWAFFPAISLFFVYLAMSTVSINASGNAPTTLAIPGSQTSDSAVAGAMVATGGGGGFIQHGLDELILVGLCFGGLIAANSLSIAGADVATKAVKSAAGAVGNATSRYVGKQSKKAGRAAFRGAGGEKAVQKMRRGEVGLGVLGKIPIIGTGANWAVKRAASLAGRAAGPHLDNSAMVKEAMKHVPENPQQIEDDLKGNMNTETTLAYLAKLREKGKLTKDTMVGNKKAGDFLDANEGTFAAYGWNKEAKEADKALGSNKAMRTAGKEIETLSRAGASTAVALTQLNAATKAFMETWERGDITKFNASAVLGERTEISQSLARYFANNAPQYASSALPKMKSAQLKSFDAMYTQIIRDEEADARRSGDIARAERLIAPKDPRTGKILPGKRPGALDLHERAMGSAATSLHGGGGGGTAAPPPAPHP